MKPLIIGDLIIKTPVIQGGMGIGISRENLASAVSNTGGLGVISGINIGYDEEGFNKDPLSTNLKSLKKHIQKAKEFYGIACDLGEQDGCDEYKKLNEKGY